jgi:hypothetical protein
MKDNTLLPGLGRESCSRAGEPMHPITLGFFNANLETIKSKQNDDCRTTL